MRSSPSLFVFGLLLASACPSAFAADPVVPTGFAAAVFGGGCFWCMESDFESLQNKGVLEVVSGYAGGPEQNPTYEQVSRHATGHAEVVKVVYDPKKITYAELVRFFFRHVDPTQKDGQFCDNGRQYRTVVFFQNDDEKKAALAERALAEQELKVKAPIVTEILKAEPFWPAEGYHQDYYKKSAGSYQRYRQGCGRDARVTRLWGTTPSAH